MNQNGSNFSTLTPVGHQYTQFLPEDGTPQVGLGWTLVNGSNGVLEAVIFTARARTEGWLGIGFTADQSSFMPLMLNTSAVIGFLEPSGAMNVSLYHLEGYDFSLFRKISNSVIQFPSVQVADGITSLHFTRLVTGFGSTVAAINPPEVSMVWAMGRAVEQGHYAQGGSLIRLESPVAPTAAPPPGAPTTKAVPGQSPTPGTAASSDLRAQVPSGAEGYTHAIVGNCGIAWKLAGDSVTFVVRAKTKGYAALGFQDPLKPSNFMQFGEGWIGYLGPNGAPFLRSYRMNGYTVPEFQLLEDYIANTSKRQLLQVNSTNTTQAVWSDGQFTNFMFTRPLNVPGGINVVPTNVGVLWAVGSFSALIHHDSSGFAFLNLLTGASSTADLTSPVGTASWIFAGAWLVLMILIGLIINSTPLHRTVFCRKCLFKRHGSAGTQTLNPITNFTRFFTGLTVIQVALLASFLGMILIFLLLQMSARGWVASLASRSFGWLNTLLLALVTLPINRRTIWIHVFGIPFERAVVFHRLIARFAWASMLTHLILMTQVYDRNIILSQIVLSQQTTPLWGFISFLCVTAMATFAIDFVRRLFWELFLGVHLFFVIPVYVFAALHVNNSVHLLILLCPLALYIIDALVRFSHRWNKAVITEALVAGDTVRVQIRLQRPIKFRPGSYVFLNCPTISVWEWHPFSISSPPEPSGGSANFTLHIKNMGKGTFTSKLCDTLSVRSAGKLFVPINIDAAYGSMASFEGYNSVILVVGGIGITPMISALADIMGRTDSVPPHVVFIWVVRKVEMLNWFDHLFFRLSGFDIVPGSTLIFKTPGGCLIEVHIYVTDPDEHGSTKWVAVDHPGAHFTRGRPNLPRLFRREVSDVEIELQGSKLPPLAQPTLVLACGPEPLIEKAQEAAAASKFDFQQETFQL